MISFLFQTTDGAYADSLAELLMEDTSMSLLDLLYQGGFLMIPLFLLSILTVYVIAERWRFLNRTAMEIEPFLNNIEALLKAGDQARALEQCDRHDKPLARILKSGIRRLGRPLQDIEEAIRNAGKKEVFEFDTRVSWLATIEGQAGGWALRCGLRCGSGGGSGWASVESSGVAERVPCGWGGPQDHLGWCCRGWSPVSDSPKR